MEEETKNWIVTALIVCVVIMCVFVSFTIKELITTNKVNKISVGDSFRVECITENPYENFVIFEGRVISKHGSFIRYVNVNGDTMTINLRDVYKSKEVFDVKVIEE